MALTYGIISKQKGLGLEVWEFDSHYDDRDSAELALENLRSDNRRFSYALVVFT